LWAALTPTSTLPFVLEKVTESPSLSLLTDANVQTECLEAVEAGAVAIMLHPPRFDKVITELLAPSIERSNETTLFYPFSLR